MDDRPRFTSLSAANAGATLRGMPKRPVGVAGAAGGGSLVVGGGIVGALVAAAAVAGIWWLERARKIREELLR